MSYKFKSQRFFNVIKFPSNLIYFSVLLLSQLRHVTSSCTGSTYTYGSSSCASCSSGSTFISSSLGCSPNSLPTDTSFYLSGSQTEGYSAFSTPSGITPPSGISYSSSVFGISNGAMTFTSGSTPISASGSVLPNTLPQGIVDWSASAWIKCPTSTTWGHVLKWGQGGSGMTSITMSVKPVNVVPVTTILDTGLNYPSGVAVDSSGNVYVADTQNHQIKKLTPSSGSPPTYTVSTILGTGLNYPYGVAVDSAGNVYVADSNNHQIKKLTPSSGSPPTYTVSTILATGLYSPEGVAVDSGGNVYVADTHNQAIKKLTPSSGSSPTYTVSTILATGLSFPRGVAVDSGGNVYVSDLHNHAIKKLTLSSGTPPTYTVSTILNTGLYFPTGVAVDSAGNVYVADSDNNQIKKLTPSSGSPPTYTVSTILGTGLNYPYGVAVDTFGNVFIGDYNNNKIKVILASILPVCDSFWHHIALTYSSTASQHSTYIDGILYSQQQISITLPSRSLSSLSIGDLFVGSLSDLRIYSRTLQPYEVESLRVTSTCTGSTYTYGSSSCASCSSGSTFISSSLGCSPNSLPTDTSFYLSGSQTEGYSAFSTPSGITPPSGISYSSSVFGISNGAMTFTSGSTPISASGSVLPNTLPQGIVDWSASAWIKCPTSTTWGHALKWGQGGSGMTSIMMSVNAANVVPVTTILDTGLNYPSGVAVDSAGNVYVADSNNHQIKKLTPSSGSPPTYTVSTILATGLSAPKGVAVDSAGNVYVADMNNHAIKKLTPSSGSSSTYSVSTILATGYLPEGVAVDSGGNVYVADTHNQAIKKLTPSSGSPPTYTVSTILATGLAFPRGVAVDSGGNVYVSDLHNHAIKKLTPSSGSPPTYTVSTILNTGLNFPTGVAVDSGGNVYVADINNNLIKKITPSSGYSVSAVLGTVLNQPPYVAVDSSGNVYFTDSTNAVKVILASSLPICDSFWHHIALTYSSTTSQRSSFIDGILYSQQQISITLPSRSLSSLTIGDLFVGSLSDLRIYSRTLQPYEVESLSLPSSASFPDNLPIALFSSYPNVGRFLFSCASGYYGSLSSLTRSVVDKSYSWLTSPNCQPCSSGSYSIFTQQGVTSCSLCPPGTYSLGSTSSCTACPSGKYGNRAGLTTSACSGVCQIPADCPEGTVYPPPPSSSSSTLSCASNIARALPTDLNMRLWPAAHPTNINNVDLIVAPEETCKTILNVNTCVDRASVVIDGITRYSIGKAIDLNMEASEMLTCESTI
jgi:DNA-binding beta-propeller fold protein YncE